MVHEPTGPARRSHCARVAATVALVCASLGLVPGTALGAAPGTRLWAANYGPSDWDFARALGVSPDGSQVFVTGYSTGEVGGYSEIATVSYDASSGAEQWASRYDIPGRGGAGDDVGVSPDGSRVYVTGYIGGAHSYDYATLAYDASTGAELWVRRYNGPTDGADTARALGVSPDGSVVFVTGVSHEGSFPSGNARYVTLAYDASTGVKLWTRRYHGPGDDEDYGSGVSGAADLLMSSDGSEVFVTGTSFEGSSSKRDYVTLSYDASTGAQLWVSRYDGPGNRGDNASAIGMSPDGSILFVTGQSATRSKRRVDYATVAYGASSGAELWVSRYDGPDSSHDYAYALGVSPDGSKVYVTGGSSEPSTPGDDYATVAYDASTGAEVWAKRFGASTPWDDRDSARALGVSPDGSQVFVTGTSTDRGGSWTAATLAYDASTGDRLWVERPEELWHALALGVSPDGVRVFAAGEGIDPTDNDDGNDYYTMAYATGEP